MGLLLHCHGCLAGAHLLVHQEGVAEEQEESASNNVTFTGWHQDLDLWQCRAKWQPDHEVMPVWLLALDVGASPVYSGGHVAGLSASWCNVAGAPPSLQGQGATTEGVSVLGLPCAPARLWREAYHKVTERGPCHSNDGRVGDAQEGDRETVGLHREEQLISLAIEDSSRLELQAGQKPGRLSG